MRAACILAVVALAGSARADSIVSGAVIKVDGGWSYRAG